MTALISKLNIMTLFTLSTSGMAELWFGCFEYYHAYRRGNTFNECLCVVFKSVAHLMKFHRLQWEVVKVKFLICIKRQTQRCNKILKVKVTTTRSKVKSRSHHDVAYLHPLTDVPTKYQLPTPYSFCDIARTRFYRSRSLRQGQIKVRP